MMYIQASSKRHPRNWTSVFTEIRTQRACHTVCMAHRVWNAVLYHMIQILNFHCYLCSTQTFKHSL